MHPDKCKHPKATEAFQKLGDFVAEYQQHRSGDAGGSDWWSRWRRRWEEKRSRPDADDSDCSWVEGESCGSWGSESSDEEGNIPAKKTKKVDAAGAAGAASNSAALDGLFDSARGAAAAGLALAAGKPLPQELVGTAADPSVRNEALEAFASEQIDGVGAVPIDAALGGAQSVGAAPAAGSSSSGAPPSGGYTAENAHAHAPPPPSDPAARRAYTDAITEGGISAIRKAVDVLIANGRGEAIEWRAQG